ncbi:hypothetical protein HAX54_027649, partial [Datura stramonium]|nr:hypothetical protein [Datura stramonium]
VIFALLMVEGFGGCKGLTHCSRPLTVNDQPQRGHIRHRLLRPSFRERNYLVREVRARFCNLDKKLMESDKIEP